MKTLVRRPLFYVSLLIAAYALLWLDLATEAFPLPDGLLLPVGLFAFFVPVVLPVWLLGWWAMRGTKTKESAAGQAVALVVPLLVCLPLIAAGLLLGFVTSWLSQCIGSTYC